MAKKDRSRSADKKPSRADNIYSSKYEKEVREIYDAVLGAYEDKNDQDTAIKRFWNVYNCIWSPNQYYQGTSQVYLPIVHDAIEARVQRFTSTLFPENGRYTEVIGNVPNNIHAIMGLLDHYVRRDHLKTKAKELLRNGEVEGQYSVYVDWFENTRYVTKKVMKHPELEPGIHDTTETFPDAEDDEVKDCRPRLTLIAAQDLAVLPPTWEDIETDAEIVAIRRWYTKRTVKRMIRDEEMDKDVGEALIKGMSTVDRPNQSDPRKDKIEAAGVKWRNNKPVALVYETWARMKIGDKRPWVKMLLCGENMIGGMFVNPNWNDRCSVISAAREKVDGSGWGKSPVDAVEQLQYQANDWANMAGDNGMYALCPIVMTDPEKNPQLATMVMNMAAVWQTSPNDTKFVEMPQLWKDALQYVNDAESRILKAFGLNPAMITMGIGSSRKPSQAMIAQENMVALATITEEVSTLEDELFTPILQRFFELDQQHRDDELTVKIYGQMGLQAQMQAVPAFAWDDRYEIMWRGSQTMKSQQANQQMIAGMNILRSLGPALPDGRKIDLAPIVETIVENIYGPRLGAKIIVDQRDQMTVPPDLENQMLNAGIQVMTHPQDNDVEHSQVHMQDMQATGDPLKLKALHLQAHQQQMQAKQQAQMQQMMAAQGGRPGSPGQPGIAGTPRPGAQPGQIRGGQNPPGAIHADRMPMSMPRKAG